MQTPLTFFFAFVVVLALIGLAAWLVRRFAGNRLGANANRGRMPRLAVIDAAAVDGRRRLVLVRRDNVEHLLMIGGPSDIVVESNIVRAVPGRDAGPQRGSDALRNPPAAEAPSWSEHESSFDHSEPEVAPRPARPLFAEEPRRPSAAMPERRPEPVSSFTPEPVARIEPRSEAVTPKPVPRSEMPRSESIIPRPMRADPPIRVTPPQRATERSLFPERPPLPERPPIPERAPIAERATVTERSIVPEYAPPPGLPPAPAAAPPAPSADQNLADMAQRLEAALRRPTSEPRSEPAEPRIGAPPVASEPTPGRLAPRMPSEISISNPSRSDAAAPVAPPVKTGFENLEDEMASLLGRPKSHS